MAKGVCNFFPFLADFHEGHHHRWPGNICYINKFQLKIDDFATDSVLGRSVREVYLVDDGVSPTLQCLQDEESKINPACFYRTHLGKMVNSIHNIFPCFGRDAFSATSPSSGTFS